jgi:flagellar biosynthesis/type III secretory pathway chaperone
MDPTNRINDLIVISNRLIDVLERENVALSDRKYSEIDEILDEKVTLGRVYESRIMGLSDDETDLNQVDGELRDQLLNLGKKVNTLIEENSTMLKIGIEANRRVVNMIAEAVKASVPNTGAYAANGANAVAEKVTTKNVAISFDRTL